MTTTEITPGEQAARDAYEAVGPTLFRSLSLGDRVRFTDGHGVERFGTLVRRGQLTLSGSVVGLTADIRYDGEVRRHRIVRSYGRRPAEVSITAIAAAPLPGELPACPGFAGAGSRCTSCRIHRNTHA